MISSTITITTPRLSRCHRITVVVLSSLVFFLDQMLVTVIVPVLPAILNITGHRTDRTHHPSHLYTTQNLSSVSFENLTYYQNLTSSPFDNYQKTHVGILFGSKGLVQLLVNPLFGVLVDRTSPVTSLIFGISMDIACSVLYAFGSTFTTCLISRCLHGLATSAIGTGGLAIIADTFYTADQRGRIIGIVNIFLFLGGSLGPAYGGTVHQYVGRVFTFLSLIPAFLVCAVLTWPVRRTSHKKVTVEKNISNTSTNSSPLTASCLVNGEKTEEKNGHIASESAEENLIEPKLEVVFKEDNSSSSAQSEEVSGTPFWRLLLDPYIMVCTLGLVVANLGHNCLAATLSIWMYAQFRCEEWQQGVVWFPSIGFHIAGTALAVWLCRQWPRSRHLFAAIGLFIGALASLAIPFIKPWILVSLPVGLIFCSVAVCDVTLLPLLNHIIDVRYSPMYGSVSAMVYTAFSLAAVIGSTLAAVIYQHLGFLWMNLGLLGLGLLYSPLILVTHRYCR